jgi:hypothetical protein
MSEQLEKISVASTTLGDSHLRGEAREEVREEGEIQSTEPPNQITMLRQKMKIQGSAKPAITRRSRYA